MSSPKNPNAPTNLPEITRDVPTHSASPRAAVPFLPSDDNAPQTQRTVPPQSPPPSPRRPPPPSPRPPQPTGPPHVAPTSAYSPGSVALADRTIPRAPYPKPEPAPVRHDASAALGGVLAASTAASIHERVVVGSVSARPQIDRPRVEPDWLVDLLWCADHAVERIRTHHRWDDVRPPPPASGEWITDGAANMPSNKDTVDVVRGLTRIPFESAESIATSLREAVDDDGIFHRPALVVGGTLTMRFEPLATLAAMVSAAKPFANDKRLSDPLDNAERAIAPGARALPAAIEALRAALVRGFVATAKSMPSNYLESAAERTMLEEHQYAAYVLFGGLHHCAHLTPPGGQPLATYLPQDVAAMLPLLRSFEVRMLVEPHARQDANERGEMALSVLALARATRL